MERAKFLKLTFFSCLILLPWLPKMEGAVPPAPGVTPRPVCASQYALANYACSMIPFSPIPPPPSSTPASNDHGRRRKHGHRHRHHHHGTPEEEDCCRWLYEIDNDCVCDMLVRLPNFLSRPIHEYSLFVGETCNVTYTCGGRVIRK
ncbi:hypothetical protein UlMin_031390 [Ulmus minor]